MKSKAILFYVNKRTREFTVEELPEKQIRGMNRVERIFDFMLDGNDDHLSYAEKHIANGLAVYRVID